MHDHLTREQIASLLDEPDAVPGGAVHLDACAECGAEFEGMSRMRMALSALPDLSAPAGEWETIQAQLSTATARPSATWTRLQAIWSTPLAVAAVLALFLGGLAVGRMLAPEGESATGGDRVAASAQPEGLTAEEVAAYPEYFRTISDLQRLRAAGPSGPRLFEEPALAAERLTRLDALITASREALRSAPADPALNDFLFDVSDERASLAGQLNQTLRQASMEY